MPRAKKFHADYLTEVCLICKRKASRPIEKEPKAVEIVKSVLENYDTVKHHIPSAICETCRRIRFTVDDLPDYEEWIKELSNLPPNTRANSTCTCSVCNIAKSKTKNSKSKKRGHSQIRESTPPPSTSRQAKVNEIMQNYSPTTRMMLSNETIKEQQANKSSPDSPVKLPSSTGGPNMPVILGKKAIKKIQKSAKKCAQIPKETMINIMNEGNKSMNDIK